MDFLGFFGQLKVANLFLIICTQKMNYSSCARTVHGVVNKLKKIWCCINLFFSCTFIMCSILIFDYMYSGMDGGQDYPCITGTSTSYSSTMKLYSPMRQVEDAWSPS